MCLATKEFEKHIALYGTDINQWPRDIRDKANQIQDQFGLEKLLEEYRALENTLHTRSVTPAHPSLAERIIANAKQRRRVLPVNLSTWVNGLFADFMIPRPAYAIAAMLVLGISIGLNTQTMTTTQDDTSLSSAYTDDDGATL